MGMCAVYCAVTDEELAELEALAEAGDEQALFEMVDEFQNEEARSMADIDKMWDVLHFVYTGVGTDEGAESPLSDAITGKEALGDDGTMSVIRAYLVGAVAAALESFDVQAALMDFSMERCAKANIYPNIWDRPEEEGFIKGAVREESDRLTRFYQRVRDEQANVLVCFQ